MGGEDLAAAEMVPRGLAGDRQWAVRTPDGGIGSGKTTRRFRRIDGLLEFRAALLEDVPVLEFPDGRRLAADDPATGERLGEVLGRPVALRPEDDVPHHDESPLHVITTAGLDRLGRILGGPVDPARFRANVVLDTDGDEDEWSGRTLHVGRDVVLRLGAGMVRCVMVDLAQRGFPRDGRILRTLADSRDLAFGLQASIVRGGTVRVGDPAVLG
jgi:uncharacterized protein YcbX